MCDGVKVIALCDSGSQIPVLSSRLFKVSDERMLRTGNLQGIVVSAVTVNNFRAVQEASRSLEG